MYDEIDYSGQGRMQIASLFAYVVVMFIIFVVALGIPPEDTTFENPILMLGLVLLPFAVYILGTIFGVLTKTSVSISTDRLVFKDESRSLSEFGSVYYEGSETANKLAGDPPAGCMWILFLLTPIALVFPLVSTTPFLNGIIVAIFCGFLYPSGYYFARIFASIKTKMVRNPINLQLTKYISIMDGLNTFRDCPYADHVIVKYRRGESVFLNLINDVHVFIVTKTAPVLEIEVSLENIVNIGLELTLALDKQSIAQKDETISVDGTQALLTVTDTGMNTLISITYQMNRFSKRLAYGNAGKNCKLLEALLMELPRYIPELKVNYGEMSFE